MNALKELGEKMQALERERAHLSSEIEVLRKSAESKATVLEGEVIQLREEVKSLRELINRITDDASPATNV
jgi:predicted  nucleic acid-binding Zn-ribbon protein